MELAHKLFSTRVGTMALSGIAAVLAAITVFAYIHHYRQSVQKGGSPATVLVAKTLIPKGTPGLQIATNRLFQAQTIRESQLRDGALSDPASLKGQVAATDILPGQQLTAADFASVRSGLAGQLAGAQRAITISLDNSHGMIGQIGSGDHVDVYAGFNVLPVDSLGRPIASGQARPVLRLIMQNVPVLRMNTSNHFGASNASSVTLQANADEAEELAFASDNGKVWLVLRPAAGARPSPPSLVTVETLLLGASPIAELRSFGGQG